MLNVFDMQDSFQVGQSNVANWFQDFENRFMEPVNRMKLTMWWKSIPPMQKDFIRVTMPTQFADLEKRYGGNNANKNQL